jgi:aryl-alcohol dehydrogenase-like predicted oxidoreductase
MRFLLAQPEVSTVIPGAKSAAQAQDNFAAGSDALSPEIVRAIRALWERELRDEPLPW